MTVAGFAGFVTPTERNIVEINRLTLVLNGSRGVLNSSARDALAAPLLRTRSAPATSTPLHQHVPRHDPHQPSPQDRLRRRPRQGTPRARGGSRELSSRACPVPSRLPRRSRARDRSRAAPRPTRRARFTRRGVFYLACARGVAPPRRALPPTRGDARGSPRRAFQNVPLLSWLGSSDPPRPRPLASAPPDPRRGPPARRRRRGARGARRDPGGGRERRREGHAGGEEARRG